MLKKLTAILLSTVTMLTVIGFMPMRAEAASSDYGMAVRKWTFHYYVRNENELRLGFHFVVDASKPYDVSYSAKVLDSDGKQVTSWKGINIYGGNRLNYINFNMNKAAQLLKPGSKYTMRITGTCVADGKEQSYKWDYEFTHTPSIHGFSAANYGKDVSYKFLEFDYGDLVANMWFSANESYDVTYRVRVTDPEGRTIYTFSDVTVTAGTSEKNYKFSTSGLKIQEPGTYTFIVDGIVNFNGVDNRHDWKFKYEHN